MSTERVLHVRHALHCLLLGVGEAVRAAGTQGHRAGTGMWAAAQRLHICEGWAVSEPGSPRCIDST